MMIEFMKPYLLGFAGGVIFTLVVIIIFAVVYWRGRKKKNIEKSRSAGEKGPVMANLKKATRESGLYIAIGFILAFISYMLLTPIMPFSGTVSDKSRYVNGRKTKVITYYLTVDGEKRTVSENIHDIAQKGDRVRHPFFLQIYEINGRAYVAESFAENTGFWIGIIFTLCMALCAGSFYMRLTEKT